MSLQVEWIEKDSVNNIIEIKALNGSFKGVSGVVNTAVKVRAWERGKAGASASGNPVVGVTNDTFLSNAWKEVDNTNLIGVYQYSIPNAVLQASNGIVYLHFEFTSGTIQDVFIQVAIVAKKLNSGVKISSDGLQLVPVGSLTLDDLMGDIGAVLMGTTEGAETSQTIFKVYGNDYVAKVKSTSADEVNRTLIERV
jgi:hypothetical protein